MICDICDFGFVLHEYLQRMARIMKSYQGEDPVKDYCNRHSTPLHPVQVHFLLQFLLLQIPLQLILHLLHLLLQLLLHLLF